MNKLLALFLATSLFACTKNQSPADVDEPESPAPPAALMTTPGISSISGPWNDNDSIVISGSLFGTKPLGTPVGWDNVESGSFKPVWTHTTGLSVNNTNNRHARSLYNGFHNFKSGTPGNGYFTGGSDSPVWFVQYWFRLDDNFDWGNSAYGTANANNANVKYFRLWSTGSINENFVIATHGFSGGSSLWTNENISGSSAYFWRTSDGASTHTSMTKGVWHSLEFEFRDSDINTGNGEIRMWFDGVKKLDVNNMITRKVHANFKRPYNVGFYDSWNDTNTDDDFYYIDDVFIDNSWARVMLGNASTFDACTVREIQPTRTWSDTTISVRANPGSFTTGQTAYLYVVDAAGVPSPGYAITIP